VTTTLGLEVLPDRCEHGFAPVHHPDFCNCADMGEWAIFVRALRAAVRDDSTIHQGDVRPLIRGRIEPKHIGQLYRRARDGGLIRDTRRKEPSNDTAGRNTDKESRIYEWTGRAA
jgi:hypothetical protein